MRNTNRGVTKRKVIEERMKGDGVLYGGDKACIDLRRD